jgi:hypothetical protein
MRLQDKFGSAFRQRSRVRTRSELLNGGRWDAANVARRDATGKVAGISADPVVLLVMAAASGSTAPSTEARNSTRSMRDQSNGQAAAAEVWRCFQWQGSSSCSWEIGHSRKAFYAHPVKDRERGGISTEQIDTHVIVIISKIIGMIECSFDVIGG